MGKTKNITKKIRFEIFKRDSFTCQYCGKSAPDVVLEVDHVKPKSKGGGNEVTNLITSCFDCNRGKGKRELNDNSTIEKKKKQLDSLQKKKEQIEMMIEWELELNNIDDYTVEKLSDLWTELTGFVLSDNGLSDLSFLVKKYNLEMIIDSMKCSVKQYYNCKEDIEKAFKMISPICKNKLKQKDKPYLKDIYYISGILRNRLHYYDEFKGRNLLEKCYSIGASLESLKDLALNVRNWTSFKDSCENFINSEEN